MTIELRPEVQAFAEAMEMKLRKHDDWPGWKDANLNYLLDELRRHVTKLTSTLDLHYGADDLKRKVLFAAADVGNFAMMVADTRVVAALTAPVTQPDERAAAEAWADPVALFILHKVTEATSLTLAEITPNLTVPDGWLSFARLWRADYIIVTGDLVQPTERGIAAMRELRICVADVEVDATDGAAKEEA